MKPEIESQTKLLADSKNPNLLATSSQAEMETEPVHQPLVPVNSSTKEIRRKLTQKQKVQKAFRVIDRIYNPLVDAASGYILIHFILSFFAPPIDNYNKRNDYSRDTFPYRLGFMLAFMLVSAGYEIYAISKNSPFLVGDPDFKQKIILERHLSRSDPSPETDISESLLTVDKTVANPRLMYDFKLAINYNAFRKVMGSFQINLFGISSLISLLSLSENIAIIIPLSTLFLIVFLFKFIVSDILSKWEIYQRKWQRLSLTQKKILNISNTLIDFLYDMMLVFGTFNIAFLIVLSILDIDTSDLSVDAFTVHTAFTSFLSDIGAPELALIYLVPPGLIYSAIQQIPSYKPRFDNAWIHFLKRFNQSLFQSTRVMGTTLLSLTTLIEGSAYLINTGNGNIAVIFFPVFYTMFIMVPIGFISAFANTFINYQEREPNKFQVMDDEIRVLREESGLGSNTIQPKNYHSIEATNQDSENTAETAVIIRREPSAKKSSCCSGIWSSFWYRKEAQPVSSESSKVLKQEVSSDDELNFGWALTK